MWIGSFLKVFHIVLFTFFYNFFSHFLSPIRPANRIMLNETSHRRSEQQLIHWHNTSNFMGRALMLLGKSCLMTVSLSRRSGYMDRYHNEPKNLIRKFMFQSLKLSACATMLARPKRKQMPWP